MISFQVLTLLFGAVLADDFPSRNSPRGLFGGGIEDSSIERPDIFNRFNFQEDSNEIDTQSRFPNRERFQRFQDGESRLNSGFAPQFSSPQILRSGHPDNSFESPSNARFNNLRPGSASNFGFSSQDSTEFGIGGVRRTPQRSFGTPSQSFAAQDSNEFGLNNGRGTLQRPPASSVGPSIPSTDSATFNNEGIGRNRQRYDGTSSRPQSFQDSDESQIGGTRGSAQSAYRTNSVGPTSQGSRFGSRGGAAGSQQGSFGSLGRQSTSSQGSRFGSGGAQTPPRSYGVPSRPRTFENSNESGTGGFRGSSQRSHVGAGNTSPGLLGSRNGRISGSQQGTFENQGRYGISQQNSGEFGIGGSQQITPQSSFRPSQGSFGSQLSSGRNQNQQRLVQQQTFGQNNRGRYGAQEQSCEEGLELGLDGLCVEPEVERNLFIYEEPSKESGEIDVPIDLPRPKLKYNVVVINSADDKNEEPIIIPPPREKTVVLVLDEDDGDQKIIEVPKSPASNPEVFFVEYTEGENPLLPGGIDLQTALQATQTQNGQQLDNNYGTPQNQNNQERTQLNGFGSQRNFPVGQQNNQQQQRYSTQNGQSFRARNLNFNQGARSNEQSSSGIVGRQRTVQPQSAYSAPSQTFGNQNAVGRNNQLPQSANLVRSQNGFQGNQNNLGGQIQIGQNAYSLQSEGNFGTSASARGSVVVKGTLSKFIRGDDTSLEFDANFPRNPQLQLNNQRNRFFGQENSQASRPQQQYNY